MLFLDKLCGERVQYLLLIYLVATHRLLTWDNSDRPLHIAETLFGEVLDDAMQQRGLAHLRGPHDPYHHWRRLKYRTVREGYVHLFCLDILCSKKVKKDIFNPN